MPDTGAPWNIPYVAPSDLVRDYPSDSEDLAEAIADGLDAAGGLVAVKHALFTGTQSASTAAGANFAVTDLSITHEVADAANKLLITAFFGAAGNTRRVANVGIAVHDGTGLIAIGDAGGSRTRVTAGGNLNAGALAAFGGQSNVSTSSVTFVHTPGTGSKTYTVRAINVDNTTHTVYINRSEGDVDSEYEPRSASGLVIQEVKV
jgi:hypothetical protein